MAGSTSRQWVAALGAMALGSGAMAPLPDPLPAGPAIRLASFECGAGYHKPTFGQCVPDAGRPLLRVNRYPINDHDIAPRVRAVGTSGPAKLLRPPAPWR